MAGGEFQRRPLSKTSCPISLSHGIRRWIKTSLAAMALLALLAAVFLKSAFIDGEPRCSGQAFSAYTIVCSSLYSSPSAMNNIPTLSVVGEQRLDMAFQRHQKRSLETDMYGLFCHDRHFRRHSDECELRGSTVHLACQPQTRCRKVPWNHVYRWYHELLWTETETCRNGVTTDYAALGMRYLNLGPVRILREILGKWPYIPEIVPWRILTTGVHQLRERWRGKWT